MSPLDFASPSRWKLARNITPSRPCVSPNPGMYSNTPLPASMNEIGCLNSAMYATHTP